MTAFATSARRLSNAGRAPLRWLAGWWSIVFFGASVLVLIPLIAALFVALRCTIPNGAALAEMRRRGEFDALLARGIDPVVTQVLPRALAGIFATVTLAALSCV